jgi:protein-tyrosine-phosphatase
MKSILFICKHNIFRSRVAEILFNKLNKNKNYRASSAGIVKWNNKDLKGDKGFEAERRVAKKMGLELNPHSKPLTSSLLKKTDIVIIVADDVPKAVFQKEKSFSGRIIVWKIPDVKENDKEKDEVAQKTIKFIDKKIRLFLAKNRIKSL